MTPSRLAIGLSIAFFFCFASACPADAEPVVSAHVKAVKRKQVSASAEKNAANSKKSASSAKRASAQKKVKRDADTPESAGASSTIFPDWEKRYIKETRITIENNVRSVIDGLHSTQDLMSSVRTFHDTWEDWSASKLFILEDDRDIDVYGNLYSLQVMCRTLRLAAKDWIEEVDSREAQDTLKKAEWLELRSRRLAEPVAEIIRNQSYSSYLPRRIEIMQDMLPYVDICYKMRPFSDVLKHP